MGKPQKLLQRILEGRSDASIRFADLVQLLIRLGFIGTIRGSHHVFRHPRHPLRLVVQPKRHLAKPYQVQQVRDAIIKYDLGGDLDEPVSDPHLLESPR